MKRRAEVEELVELSNKIKKYIDDHKEELLKEKHEAER
jgi:hypothetical protein